VYTIVFLKSFRISMITYLAHARTTVKPIFMFAAFQYFPVYVNVSSFFVLSCNLACKSEEF
jgi:hypothetical protein